MKSLVRRSGAALAAALMALAVCGAANPAASAGSRLRRTFEVSRRLQTFPGVEVSLFASGLKNPTSFAFGLGAIFAGDSGSSGQPSNGGVYVLRRGRATEIPHSPNFVAGMQFHGGVLYLSAATIDAAGPRLPRFQILAWSGWNGTMFTKRDVVYTAPANFQGFNGLAFGPDGRLYVGVDTGLLNYNDHGPATLSPYLYDILSMNPDGTDLKVFASGIRQPWQMVFDPGSSALFVSDLGQDGPMGVKPPDFLLKVKAGDDFGFPQCNHTDGSRCKGFTKPFMSLIPHMDPMGLAIIGRTLYVGSYKGEFGNSGGALYSMPIAGDRLTPVVTDFPLATDALAANGGYLYVGGSTANGAGYVYRVKP